MTALTKEIVPSACVADALIGRLSLHEYDPGCVTFKFGVTTRTDTFSSLMEVLRWLLSTWSVHRAVQMDWSGLINMRKARKGMPLVKSTRMLMHDTNGVCCSSGSLQLAR